MWQFEVFLMVHWNFDDLSLGSCNQFRGRNINFKTGTQTWPHVFGKIILFNQTMTSFFIQKCLNYHLSKYISRFTSQIYNIFWCTVSIRWPGTPSPLFQNNSQKYYTTLKMDGVILNKRNSFKTTQLWKVVTLQNGSPTEGGL